MAAAPFESPLPTAMTGTDWRAHLTGFLGAVLSLGSFAAGAVILSGDPDSWPLVVPASATALAGGVALIVLGAHWIDSAR